MNNAFIICDEDNNLNKILQEFNNYHRSVTFTMEADLISEFNFLDIFLERRSHWSLQRSLYRKPAWNGQQMNFYSWVPLSRKRNLVHFVSSRARWICTAEIINYELNMIRRTLLENGLLPYFIDGNLNRRHLDKEFIPLPRP